MVTVKKMRMPTLREHVDGWLLVEYVGADCILSQDVTAVIKHSSGALDINPFENSNNVIH